MRDILLYYFYSSVRLYLHAGQVVGPAFRPLATATYGALHVPKGNHAQVPQNEPSPTIYVPTI